MAFWIAFALPNGTRDTGSEVALTPEPAEVDYPPEPAGTLIDTGGTVVFQQPSRDQRIRRWVWRHYAGTHAAYTTLWNQLQPLRSRYRLMAGESPYVYLKDDESLQLRTIATPGTVVTPSYPWFKCRVLEVTRRPKAGLVVYDETFITFVVDDVSYNDLG